MSNRIEQINQLIKKQLGDLIKKEIELPSGCLLTITEVQTSPDLKNAKIMISVLPENLRGTVLKLLKKNTANLKKLLKKNITIKFTPNLFFLIDEQQVFASEIDKLLDELK